MDFALTGLRQDAGVAQAPGIFREVPLTKKDVTGGTTVPPPAMLVDKSLPGKLVKESLAESFCRRSKVLRVATRMVLEHYSLTRNTFPSSYPQQPIHRA